MNVSSNLVYDISVCFEMDDMLDWLVIYPACGILDPQSFAYMLRNCNTGP